MKKPLSKVLILVLAAVLAYAAFTPEGALRTGMLLSGHPVSALTMDVREATADDVGLKKLDNPKGTILYHIGESAPFDPHTAAKLENWIVERYGPICVARYYGYC